MFKHSTTDNSFCVTSDVAKTAESIPFSPALDLNQIM